MALMRRHASLESRHLCQGRLEAVLGNLPDEGPRRIIESVRRRAGDDRRHIGNTIMDHPFVHKCWVTVCCGAAGFDTASLIDGDIHEDRPRLHGADHLACYHNGCPGSGIQHGPNDHIGKLDHLGDIELVRHHRDEPSACPAFLIKVLQAGKVLVEHVDARTGTEEGMGCGRAECPGPNNDDFGGWHTGDTPQKDSLPSVVVLHGQQEIKAAKEQNVDPYVILTKEAEQAPLGSEGLFFLPYLMGERSPHGDANARGVYFGLSLRHQKSHLIRAILEGVTFGMRDSLEIIKGLKVPIKEIRATGGGARSSFWCQLQADIFGEEIVTINSTEGPALGAAILAGVGAGVYKSIPEACDSVVQVVKHHEPNMKNHKLYNESFQFFDSLYPQLKKSFTEDSQIVQRLAI